MTAIRDAFAKAGGPSPMFTEFQVALSRLVEGFRNRGLPVVSIASALVSAANSFRRETDVGHSGSAQQGHSFGAPVTSLSAGHWVSAGNGQMTDATLSEPKFAGSEGQPSLAAKAIGFVPPGEPYSSGEGHKGYAGEGHINVAPPREPPTPTEAGRVLRALPHPPGAGALRQGAFAARQSVRGESWLLTYQIPNGRDALSMRIGELLPTANRMLRDGAGQMHAAVVLRRLHDEAHKLGQVSPDQVVGKTLPPAVIDRLSEELTPERVIVEAAKWGKKFVDERALLAGGI